MYGDTKFYLKNIPTTLRTKVWRCAGIKAICGYFLPPSSHPPTAIVVFKFGFFSLWSLVLRNERFPLTSLCNRFIHSLKPSKAGEKNWTSGSRTRNTPSDVTDTAERVDGAGVQVAWNILNVVAALSRTGNSPVTEVTNSSSQSIRLTLDSNLSR